MRGRRGKRQEKTRGQREGDGKMEERETGKPTPEITARPGATSHSQKFFLPRLQRYHSNLICPSSPPTSPPQRSASPIDLTPPSVHLSLRPSARPYRPPQVSPPSSLNHVPRSPTLNRPTRQSDQPPYSNSGPWATYGPDTTSQWPGLEKKSQFFTSLVYLSAGTEKLMN